MSNNALLQSWPSKKSFLLALLLLLLYTGFAQSAIRSYKKHADGVLFSLTHGAMQIRVCLEDIIEVKYTVFDSSPVIQSLVVNNPFNQKVNFELHETANDIVIA